jgi:hypothetical protein
MLPFGSVLADAPKSKNAEVTLVYQHELPNVPGNIIKGVLVEYGPGGYSPGHTHAKSAFIYATVLEGAIRSQVNDGPVTTYKARQSFSERDSARPRRSGFGRPRSAFPSNREFTSRLAFVLRFIVEPAPPRPESSLLSSRLSSIRRNRPRLSGLARQIPKRRNTYGNARRHAGPLRERFPRSLTGQRGSLTWAALHYLQVSRREEDHPLFPSFHRDALSGLPCDPVHNID